MSDTPRTDAAIREVDVAFVGHWGLSSEPQEFVAPEFARELERENAALREELQQSEDRFRNIPDEVWSKADLVEMTNKALKERDEADRQNAELRKALRAARPYVCWTDDEGRIPEDYPDVAELIRKDAELIDTLLAKENKP